MIKGTYTHALHKTTRFITFILLVIGMFATPSFSKTKTPEPDFPPRPGEYYPISPESYPGGNMANPYPHVRDLSFQGKPLDIYTKINMATQIQLPSPPTLINMGSPESFVVEVVPEYNAIFVRPVRQVEITNMIVHTEAGGVYLFVLKENPFTPYDMLARVSNPHRTITASDTRTLVGIAHSGRRPAEFQLVPMEIRTPDSSAYIYDPLTKTGCRVMLRRAVSIPRENKLVYWIELENAHPQGIEAPSASFAVDEKTVWTQGLQRVAVPGFRDGTRLPLLSRGDKLHMFMITSGGALPSVMRFRFALYGARNLPVEVNLPVSGAGGRVEMRAASSVDEKLKQQYEELVRQGKINPVNPDDIAPNEGAPEQNQPVFPKPSPEKKTPSPFRDIEFPSPNLGK